MILRILIIFSLSNLLAHSCAIGQQNFKVTSSWLQYSDAPNSLYHNLANQAYIQLDRRDSMISGLHSLSDWKQRQQWVRNTLKDIVGPFPEKTPLNARITKKIKKEDYSIENIIFESQPKFYVTSSLFIPNGLKKKVPAIIYVSGHTTEGYRSPIYQHVILNLVKKGFIVFAFDPVGQGERLQYYDEKTGNTSVDWGEHSYSGAQAFITGSSQARYEIWDGIRAVDYLFTRKEVDTSRIGITGRSGGGTQSAYIAAFDDRIYAAAPENYITNFTRLLQAIGPQDAEQNLFHGIARGIDQPDLLEIRAPKPTLVITTTRDIFPIRGSIETAREVARIYDAYGKETHFQRVEDDTSHASSQKNREAMYAFFQKYLRNPGDSTDIDTKPLSKGELQVTKTGQVSTSIGDASTVFSLNLKEAKNDMDRLKELRSSSEYYSKALQSAKKLSGYHKPAVYHRPVFTGRYQKKGYVVEKYFVQGEGNYVIPFLLMVPDKPNGKAVVCLNPEGKEAEVKNGDMSWFVRSGFTVLSPDLLGTGELHPNFEKNYSFMNGPYAVWFLSILIGRSVVGVQAGDVVRLIGILEEENGIEDTYGLARGAMSSVMLYAAAFDQQIKRVCLINPLSSYRSLVMNRFYNPGFLLNSAVAGALKAYDLPDIAASLAPRKLMIIDMVDGQNRPVEKTNSAVDLSIIKASYQNGESNGQLNIIYNKSIERPYDLFEKWLK